MYASAMLKSDIRCNHHFDSFDSHMQTLSSSPSNSTIFTTRTEKLLNTEAGTVIHSQKWKMPWRVFYIQTSTRLQSRQRHSTPSRLADKDLSSSVYPAFASCICIFYSHIWSLHISRVFRYAPPFHFSIFRLPNGKLTRTHTHARSVHTHNRKSSTIFFTFSFLAKYMYTYASATHEYCEAAMHTHPASRQAQEQWRFPSIRNSMREKTPNN